MSFNSLFANGERGFVYEPYDPTTLFQDSDGNTPVDSSGQPVGLVLDNSGNVLNGTQSVSSKRPTYTDTPSRLVLDGVDDEIVVVIPTGGFVGSLVVATDEGTASYGVDIPAGNYTIAGQYFAGNSINGVLLREGSVSESELTSVEQTFVNNGATASYVGVSDFTQFWRNRSDITQFPILDTSSGTIFYRTWRECSSLTSFPLLDVSNGTDFGTTWYECSSLTSFPTLNMPSGTSFNFTWSGCNSLTSFPLIDMPSGTSFSSTWQGCNSLTSFPLIDMSSGTSFSSTWRECSSLTSFPLLDVSNGTFFSSTWQGCSSLTSFPLIDMPSGTSFSSTWQGCSSLTSFPLIDMSSGTSFSSTWRECSSLTSFPLLDVSNGIFFANTWFGCDSLTSFPLLDVSSGTYFGGAWQRCSNLTSFPANFFDNCLGTNFSLAFSSTNLSQQSIDDILVSINTNNTSDGTFNQSGGSAPSATGEAAATDMRNRGWTVETTQPTPPQELTLIVATQNTDAGTVEVKPSPPILNLIVATQNTDTGTTTISESQRLNLIVATQNTVTQNIIVSPGPQQLSLIVATQKTDTETAYVGPTPQNLELVVATQNTDAGTIDATNVFRTPVQQLDLIAATQNTVTQKITASIVERPENTDIITIETSQAPDAKPVARSLVVTTGYQELIKVPNYNVPELIFGGSNTIKNGVGEVISPLVLCNTTNTTAIVDVETYRYVENTKYYFIKNLNIPAYETISIPLNGQFFKTGDMLQIKGYTEFAVHAILSFTLGQSEEDDV